MRASLILLTCISACVASPLAEAQQQAGHGGYQVDLSKLPKADKMPVSRRKIQIVDESPEINDTRQAPQSNNVIINVAPLQPTGTTTVINVPGNTSTLGSPGGAGGPGTNVPVNRSGNPNQVVIDLNKLPRAGFESHAGRVVNRGPASGLPNGTSTGIHGALTVPSVPRISTSAPVQGRQPQAAQVPKTTPVLMQSGSNYKTASTSANSGQQSTTSVSGRLTSHPLKGRLGGN